MNIYQYLSESLRVAASRSATQVASIIIVALLGGVSTELLATFSLALSAAAIYFVATTAIQYGVQAELSKSFGEGNQRDLLGIFFAGLWFVMCISFIAVALAYLLPNPFTLIEQKQIGADAFSAYQILVLSLPVVGVSAAIHYLLEAHQKIPLVFKLKLATVSLQLLAVIWIIYGNPTIQAYEISLAYLATDFAGLFISVIACASQIEKGALLQAAKSSCNFVKQKQIYFRALRTGGPVSAGAVAQKYLFYYMGVYCAGLGVASASAFAILNSITFLLQIPVIGLAHLATIKLSFAIGAKDTSKFESYLRIVTKSFFLTVFFVGSIAWFILPSIVTLFSRDPLVISSITGLGNFFILFYLLNCCLSLLLSMLRGLSDSLYPQLAVNGSLFLVMVPSLEFASGIGFSQVISFFCAIGFLVVTGLIARWKVVLNRTNQREPTPPPD